MSKSNVTIKTEIKLRPFGTPNFVIPVGLPGRRQDGFKEMSSIPLSELSSETLGILCNEFRKEVFQKAGKEDSMQ